MSGMHATIDLPVGSRVMFAIFDDGGRADWRPGTLLGILSGDEVRERIASGYVGDDELAHVRADGESDDSVWVCAADAVRPLTLPDRSDPEKLESWLRAE
jgi:hypothetical protein